MNIFILDDTPKKCAEQQCDKHCVKMVLESAQMLCSIQRHLGNDDEMLYKVAHLNHPCTVWARQTTGNYHWLLSLFNEQLAEYTYRYGKIHSSQKLLPLLSVVPTMIPNGDFTLPALCVPDLHKPLKVNSLDDVITAYRKFYMTEKRPFAKWAKARTCPEWWVDI